MARSKGIDRHPIYKLGKAPRAPRPPESPLRRDPPRAGEAPPEYDFDLKHPGIPVPMFANDRYGDCVIAGRAHQTLRFELLEQRAKLRITDDEVIAEYLAETGGEDSGLVVLDSLSRWRREGWIAAKRRYRIRAYTEIDRARRREVKQAIVLDVGVGLGLALPISAQAQFQSGKPWDVVRGPGRRRQFVGRTLRARARTTRSAARCASRGGRSTR